MAAARVICTPAVNDVITDPVNNGNSWVLLEPLEACFISSAVLNLDFGHIRVQEVV